MQYFTKYALNMKKCKIQKQKTATVIIVISVTCEFHTVNK